MGGTVDMGISLEQNIRRSDTHQLVLEQELGRRAESKSSHGLSCGASCRHARSRCECQRDEEPLVPLPDGASLFRAAAGSIALGTADLGLLLSFPLLSGGFTACGREGGNINRAERERSPLKTQTERKDGLAWLGPAPCSQALMAILQPQLGHQPEALQRWGCCFERKDSFCWNHCTDCPGQGPQDLWA